MLDYELAAISPYPSVYRGETGTDPYNEFDNAISPADRQRLYGDIVRLAVELGIDDPDGRLLVSGFGEGYEPAFLDEVDARKLAVRSAAPAHGIEGWAADEGYVQTGFDGDDSNQSNIIERERHALRQERRQIGQELQAADDEGVLTDAVRQAAAERLAGIAAEIRRLGELQARPDQALPVYYATPLHGILDDDPENNPLAYLPEAGEPGYLAVFDKRSLADAGIPVAEKNDVQYRIVGAGRNIMAHCVAVIHI